MNHPEDWEERTKIVASFIEPNSYVVDFGAGERRLANYLPTGCLYTPFDIESKEDQFRFDVESDDWSVVPGNYDVAVVCGLLEHIYLPVKFLAKITAPVILLSYNDAPADLTDEEIARRKNAGWKNNYSSIELEDIMRSIGYYLECWENWNEQIICKFVKESND